MTEISMTFAIAICALAFVASIGTMHHALNSDGRAEAGQVASIIWLIGLIGMIVSSLTFAFIGGMAAGRWI